MSQIYCRKINGFEFVVYPDGLNHIVLIKTDKSVVCKPLFSSEAFNPPAFEVNVQNAHFRYKNHLYRVSNAEELLTIPDWFNSRLRNGHRTRITMNAQEKFMLDGINTKREVYMKSIGFYP